jgi:hypothetical protein
MFFEFSNPNVGCKHYFTIDRSQLSNLFFFFVVLGFKLRAYTLGHTTTFFVMGTFEIGSHELFAQVGFEL